MPVTGSELVAQALEKHGVDTFFFLMGAPMLGAEKACIDRGMRGIDVRHEQGAAMMAHAYSRVANKSGVCMACSGPGTINLVSGLATALIDCAPVVALGGSSPWSEWGTGSFQEIDQVALARPMVKWAERCYETRRIPEMIDLAFRTAWAGKPGPVYLDFPTDVLLGSVDEAAVVWPKVSGPVRSRPQADAAGVEAAIGILAAAEKPVVLSGSGVLWSDAAPELRSWIEASGMPFYTTPQGRGVVPEDHPLCFPNARSTALKEADAILVVGTRVNYVFGHLKPPRFRADARVIRIDVDPGEIASTQRLDVGLVGDAKAVLMQLATAARGRVDAARYAGWRERLQSINVEKQAAQERDLSTDQMPHPPAAAVQGGTRLHAARCDPLRRWPGNPQLRPTVDPDARGGASAELRSVRHHGGRHALRRGCEDGQARHAGDRAAWRWFVRPERVRTRHRGAPSHSRTGGDQPERRLDR